MALVSKQELLKTSDDAVQLISLPLVPTVNEILGVAAKERSLESPSGTEEGKSSKGVYVCVYKHGSHFVCGLFFVVFFERLHFH